MTRTEEEIILEQFGFVMEHDIIKCAKYDCPTCKRQRALIGILKTPFYTENFVRVRPNPHVTRSES